MVEKINTRILNREQDSFSHTIDTRHAARITDEIVERTDEKGNKLFGEVIATFGSGYEGDFDSEAALLDSYGTMCVVRYSDKSIGIASRAYQGDVPVLHPGYLLEKDSRVYFGRSGDVENGEPVMMNRTEILGRKALTGLVSNFEPSVSRIQGSLQLWPDGTLDIHDGYEYAHPETRIVIDKASGNSTRVHTLDELSRYQQNDVIAPLIQQQEMERREQRLVTLFGVPESKPRDRFGNVQDRVSLITQESKQEAAQSISAINDLELRAIIDAHTVGLSSAQSVEKIFSDESTRIDIAKYLMQKVAKNADLMPDRVKGHREKSGNHPGYPQNMSSKEYAALLALSMLDGTFISKRSIGDPVEFVSRGNNTDINGGQHRLAALQLLDLDSKKAPKVIEQVRTYY